MIDRGRTRLWLLAIGLLALSLSMALLARAQEGTDPGAASSGAASGPDAAEVEARLEDLLTRAGERLQEASPDAATLGAEVAALRQDLATARAQIEILKSAVVEAVIAQSSTEAELRRLKGEPSGTSSDAPGEARPAMATVPGDAEGASGELPAASGTRSLRSGATDAPAAGAEADVGPLLLTEIHFNPGDADLTPGGRRKATEAAERLGSLPEGTVRVVGHTDTVGGADYNRHLALRRADSIAGLLTDLGVPRERIEIVGAGEEALPEPTPDQVAEPLNRCAGIILVADAPAAGPEPQSSEAPEDAGVPEETQMAAVEPQSDSAEQTPAAEAAPGAADPAQMTRIGGVTIHDPWASASIGATGSSAVYMTLEIDGDETDRLVSAETPVAERIELHGQVMDQGSARMRRVSALEVAPGAPTVLQPQGLHLMLVGLRDVLSAGDTLPLTLTFEKAGRAEIELPVLDLAAGLQRVGAQEARQGEVQDR